MISPAVFGRDALLGEVWGVLAGPGRVLLDGPAGIGKTAVFGALVARAQAAGMRVMSCSPAEAERTLPLAAVADLLESAADRVGLLPPPQRAAVEAVLLAAEPDTVLDERALGAATRALIEAVVDAVPAGVLVAVDDAQWLDPPSERALRFALRRMSNRVAVLVSSRSGEGEPETTPLGLDDTSLLRAHLDPLGVGALQRVISDRFAGRLSRPLLTRVAHESGGNPLVAIELARALLRLPSLPGPGEDLPVAASLQDLVSGTLSSLPAAGRDAVRLAALLATPSSAAIAETGIDPTSFDAAEEAGLIRVTAEAGIEFVHPVYATAVRADIPRGMRRRLHARLAEACTDRDERARHLLHSASAPDVDAATEVAHAAARARARGSPELAAQLYERAAQLMTTQEPGEAHGWQLAAARCRFDSGDYPAAAAQADAVAAQSSGHGQAEALLLRASIAWSVDDLVGAIDAAERALAAADARSALAGEIHAHLASFIDDPGPARDHAEAALALLAAAPPDAGSRSLLGTSVLPSALMLLFLAEVRAGSAPRLDLLERALTLEGSEPTWLAGTVPAIWWKGVDDHDRARRRLRWMLERAEMLGDEPVQHEVMIHLGETELLAGRYRDAEQWITRATELGDQLASGLAAENWLRGLLAVHTGELATAAQLAEDGLRDAATIGGSWHRRLNLQLAGVAALADGRAADAAEAFGELADAVVETGFVEPIGTRFEADWVEACVGVGELDTATQAQARLEARHALLPRPWTALGVARGRVLLAGARAQGADHDDLASALADLDAARQAVPHEVVPFDRARCLLVAGMALRRARRKKPARDALQAAADEFRALGARAHAARAVSELERVGRPASAPGELTPTEDRIARLAATGLTNRAIADALFVSPKTVEANLARAYRKLGISSRAELGALMSGRDQADA